MTHAEQVKNHFDAAAASYGENFNEAKSGKNFGFKKRLEIVLQLLQGRKGRLLECACGTGEITQAVLETGSYNEAVICDISAEMLASAKTRIGSRANTNFVNSEIFTFLEKETRKFDVIVCLGLIAHTGQLERLLQLFKSRLAPGGCIVLQSSLAEHFNVRFMRLLSGARLDKKIGYRMHYFTYSDIQQTAATSGLKITASRRFAFALPFGDRACKYLNYRFEQVMEPLSQKIGSECVMLLGHH